MFIKSVIGRPHTRESKHSKKGEQPPGVRVSGDKASSPCFSLSPEPSASKTTNLVNRGDVGSHIPLLCISVTCSLLQLIKRKWVVMALPFIPSHVFAF